MDKRRVGRTDLTIDPLVFGGNVFGWTADKITSFAILDKLADTGLTTIDTADVYSTWVPGNSGGESESIIGEWMQSTKRRSQITLITKVGMDMGAAGKGLSAAHIESAVEASLKRLRTDYIDIYFSHKYDPDVAQEETLAAHDRLIKAGKVRVIGASNYDAEQLRAALDVSAARNLARYEILQPGYNLYDRSGFDGPLRDLAMAEEIAVIPYYSLARGFLSGKYRSKSDMDKSPRGAAAVENYLNERGIRILDALDEVSERHQAQPAEVALAWLMARPGITAPIASASRLEQLDSLINAVALKLDSADIALLDDASRY